MLLHHFATVKASDLLKVLDRYSGKNYNSSILLSTHEDSKSLYICAVNHEYNGEYDEGVKIPVLRESGFNSFVLNQSHIKKIKQLIKKSEGDVVEMYYLIVTKVKKRTRWYSYLMPRQDLVILVGEDELIIEKR